MTDEDVYPTRIQTDVDGLSHEAEQAPQYN